MRIHDRSSAAPALALFLAAAGAVGTAGAVPAAATPRAGDPARRADSTAGAVTEPAAEAVRPSAPTVGSSTPTVGPPPGVAELAATLPPLPRTGGALALPLAAGDAAAPFAWRPVRGGVALHAAERGLEASYRVVTGQPAGAALVVRPGTFAGIDGLRVRAGANRNAQLLVTLQDATGAVYTLPAVPLRIGTPREHERRFDEATYFPPQSSAPDSGGLDPAEIVMVTLLDVSGFTGPDTPEVEWTVEAIEAVVR